MLYPFLPLTLTLLTFSLGLQAEPPAVPTAVQLAAPIALQGALEPCLNGEVSASGLFPTQAMEDEYAAYLGWTRERGLGRLAAFEAMIEGRGSVDGRLASRAMEAQFDAYLRWVGERGLSPFLAFTAADPR
jgi:hypothetical protein